MTEMTIEPTSEDVLIVRRLSYHYPHPILALRAIETGAVRVNEAVKALVEREAQRLAEEAKK